MPEANRLGKDGGQRRVAILINSLEGGGAERVVSILLGHLHGKIDGLELILVHPGCAYKVPPGLRIFNLMEQPLPGFALLLRLPLLAIRLCKLIRRRKYVLVQSHLFIANYLNILAAMLGAGHIKQIVNCVAVTAKYGGNSPADWLHRILIRLLYRRADTLIGKSHGLVEDLHRYTRIPRDVRVIHNPFPSVEINALMRETVPENPFWGKYRFKVVCLARFHPHKRQMDLLDAFALLAPSRKDLGLVFLGSGETQDSVQARAHALSLGDRVLFAGRVSNPYPYLARCQVFVLPSAAEGFPNALVEAMICGMPVIVSDCLSGPREILAPGTGIMPKAVDLERHDGGFLVPVGRPDLIAACIETLMDRPDLLEATSMGARRRAMDFDESEVIESYRLLLSPSQE